MPSTSRLRFRLVLPLLAALLGAPAAFGETIEEGHVVALENGELIVDLAGNRGASSGDLLELWRPLDLKHPVTGKRVRDRFRIGTLRLTQVRDSLSLAKVEGSVSRPPEPGDVIVLRRTKPEVADAPTHTPPAGVAPKSREPAPAPASAGSDPEERRVATLFDGLRNSDVSQRISAYENYVRETPEGRFAAVLWEEAQYLRRLFVGGAGDQEIRAGQFTAPKQALAGRPLELALELRGGARGAVLHTRNRGEVAYVTTVLEPAGPGYFSARLPAARVAGTELQFFIEATNADGKALPVVGSADEPEFTRIVKPPTATAPSDPEATLSLWTDYADYNRLRGNDVVWQTEGFAGLRFSDTGIRALRSGFGVFRGVGGSLEELDEQNKSARKVGLTYGYLEGEYAFNQTFSLVARLILGLRDDGIASGSLGMVRIGSDRGTNVQIGGEVLGGIGLRGITQLELATFERVPIMFRTEVTNQPAGSTATAESVVPERPGALPENTSLARGEVGARAIAQVGYELMPDFVVSARASYQGRTIKHAGPGFGGAVTYTW